MKKRLLYFLLIVSVLPLLIFQGYILLLQSASYNQFLGMIRKADEGNRDRLYYIIGNLVDIPPEIGDLRNLKHLSIQYNSLKTIPPEIGKLTNLTLLSFPDNRLAELPPEIGKLTNLTFLVLSYNQLRELPPEIGKLSNLETLLLDNNNLTSLPPEIGNLTKLTDLDLANNPYDAPKEIIEQGDWAIFEYYANQNRRS